MRATRFFDLHVLRAKAIRQRSWHKVLDDIERGIVNLTLKLVEDVKSLTLSIILKDIVEKLELALNSYFLSYVSEYGIAQLGLLVEYAKFFGSNVADYWLQDKCFPRLLALNSLYDLQGWRS